MIVFLYQQRESANWDQLVLWDGENIYWDEHMRASSGYTEFPSEKWSQITDGRFVYIGKL